MSDLSFTASDTAPTIFGALTNTDGTALDLTDATGVRFQMRPAGTFAYTVDGVADIGSPATAGSVSYNWAAGDLAVPGEYVARWQITWSDGSIQHSEPENTITVDPA